MLILFKTSCLPDLYKAYIHGYYRRHPNGQQVWVDSYSDKRPERHRTEFAHWQHRIEHFKDHLAQGHTREALHAFHDLGHDDSHKLARDLGLHDDGPEFADKKTLMGAVHGRILARKQELQAKVGAQVKADFEKRKAAGTVGKRVGKAPKELTPGKGQLHTDSQGNQFLILARPNTWNNQDAGVRYELHEKLTGADRKFHKKSVSTYTLTAMQQSVSGRMQELGTQQAKVADADDSLLVTAKPGPQKVVPKKHHEKTLQEYTLERAKKNKLPADHAGNAAWARIEHREAIQRASAMGTQIAPEVVADHPELAPKAEAPTKAKDTVTMPKQELIAEHEKLVAVLKSPDHADDLKEAKEQEKELKGYKGDVGKTDDSSGAINLPAPENRSSGFRGGWGRYFNGLPRKAPGFLVLQSDRNTYEAGWDAAKKAHEQEAKRQGISAVKQPSAAQPPPPPPDSQPTKSGYYLPGDINKDWGDDKEYRNYADENYQLSPRQQKLIAAVAQSRRNVPEYRHELIERVADLLGIDDATRKRNYMRQTHGDLGYDIFHAERILDDRASRNSHETARQQLNLKPGDKLGTLDVGMKVTSAVVVPSTDVDGDRIWIEAYRGSGKYREAIDIDLLQQAIDGAKQKGWRKDGYQEFIVTRSAPPKRGPVVVFKKPAAAH